MISNCAKYGIRFHPHNKLIDMADFINSSHSQSLIRLIFKKLMLNEFIIFFFYRKLAPPWSKLLLMLREKPELHSKPSLRPELEETPMRLLLSKTELQPGRWKEMISRRESRVFNTSFILLLKHFPRLKLLLSRQDLNSTIAPLRQNFWLISATCSLSTTWLIKPARTWLLVITSFSIQELKPFRSTTLVSLLKLHQDFTWVSDTTPSTRML